MYIQRAQHFRHSHNTTHRARSIATSWWIARTLCQLNRTCHFTPLLADCLLVDSLTDENKYPKKRKHTRKVIETGEREIEKAEYRNQHPLGFIYLFVIIIVELEVEFHESSHCSVRYWDMSRFRRWSSPETTLFASNNISVVFSFLHVRLRGKYLNKSWFAFQCRVKKTKKPKARLTHINEQKFFKCKHSESTSDATEITVIRHRREVECLKSFRSVLIKFSINFIFETWWKTNNNRLEWTVRRIICGLEQNPNW